MEKKPENSGLTGAVPVTVVLAMLASLVFTHLSPYQDERPSNHPVEAHFTDAQDVDARLWQDPFAAIDSASKETPTEKLVIMANQDLKTLELEAMPSAKSPSHERDQIYKGNQLENKSDITVIAVTLPGGPYQEAAEDRMRRRYAVLSALANQKYTPRDEQHIGYFHPKSKMDLQKRVAFEWWSLREDNKKVLLLWVDESSLLGCPATKLKELLGQTNLEKPLGNVMFHYTVIGPNSSTLLRDMLKEVEATKKKANVAQCPEGKGDPGLGEINDKPIVYYSIGATASDYYLLKEAFGHAGEDETVSGYLDKQGVALYRTTATDRNMMDIVVDELDLRQVRKTDHVVILSEWDTFYGRNMPRAFKHAWRLLYPNRYKPNDEDENKEELPIKVYGYMRGLDGVLPDKGNKTTSAAEKMPDSKDKEKSDTDSLIESSEGQNQKDYLRRLADNINILGQEYKDQGYEQGVAAIGVLGYDVHDKLMILEALRQFFPHKLFFTTDLDAAYNHPSKRRQTHNLLVASAFDLKLRPELQGEIPPFRDSYQTAFFLATQMALKDESNIEKALRLFDEGLGQQHSQQFFATYLNLPFNSLLKLGFEWQDKFLYPRHIHARLFEIGRNRPMPLPIKLDNVLPRDGDENNKFVLNDCLKKLPECYYNLIFRGIPLPNLFDNKPDHSRTDQLAVCSWDNWSNCETVQSDIISTSNLVWTSKGLIAVLVAALFCFFISSWIREKFWQFTTGVGTGVGLVFIPALFLTWIDSAVVLYWMLAIWGASMVLILCFFKRIREKVQIKPTLSWGLAVGALLLLAYRFTPLWNNYITGRDAEPFYWLEGVSIWPSQLLRLSVVLFASVFFWWGHSRIKKMQEELQEQEGGGKIPQTFALPKAPTPPGYWDVLFIGNWKINKENIQTVYPDGFWKKFLGYFGELWKKFLGHFGIDMKGGFVHFLGAIKVFFIGNSEINKENTQTENTQTVYPDELWKKYLCYFGSDMKGGFLHFLVIILVVILAAYVIYLLSGLMNGTANPDFVKNYFYIILIFVLPITFIVRWLFKKCLPGWLWRLMIHGFVFFGTAVFIYSMGEPPNLPARGDFAKSANFYIITLAVLSTIFLITWVVENARLCGRLIDALSAKPSKWNKNAKNWAITKAKVAPECVEDWLDIQLVASLTATMQPLIFGPVVCIALLVSARIPIIDDWNIPRELEIVYIVMLLYAISAEVFLQRGATSARKKAIVLLTKKISEQRNRNPPNSKNEDVIKRIEAEIEHIKDLREGAFRPWYEMPLLQSFGGFGSLWLALQYIVNAWEKGAL